ncbi:RAD50-interacting protein 1 [Leptopilina heterotoma]|uniref:RAD50-interacting protein 1 n=1 Tax=Leptopilina heterotoma TaxID=63436 RepID=UPI001CA95AF1|nr:RAD50-interacting protein 1 [Leptopilina heterotoma]
MDIEARVIKRFNEKLGSDLKNLENLHKFHEELESEKNVLEESLSLASAKIPLLVEKSIADVNDMTNRIYELKSSCRLLQKEIQESLKKDDKMLEYESLLNKINELEKSLFYLNTLQSVQEISGQIEVSLFFGVDEATIEPYALLTHKFLEWKSSPCKQLSNHIREILHYWHNNIKEKLSKEYSEVLKAIKWPFCGTNLSVSSTSSAEAMAKFKTLTEYLFHLQLPDDSEKPTVTSALLTDFAPISLPIVFLVRPLRQRFIFHFTGTKQTNRRDKPEWFFTQVLTWIKGHSDWVARNVQPIARSAGYDHINVKDEFMRALVQMAVEKLHSELPVVQYDDSSFAHTVDEALGFERELRESFFYPESQPATLSVLTQAQIFVKWINMEKKYATEKMDAILSSPTAWEKLPGPDVDNLKVTECAEAFLNLLTTISDRYNHLPQPGHRAQFLELQLELIDDWRVRLLQLLHEDYEDPLASLMPRILNSLHYVQTVLSEWGVTVHFLKLHFYKKQLEAVEIATDIGENIFEDVTEEHGTVFDDAIALLQRLEKKLVTEISDSVALDVKAKSRPYRTDKWFAMQSEKEILSLSVTPSGCSMFQELALRLHALNEALALPLFNQAWRNLASQLDLYIFEEVVLVNKFNSGGAVQLQYDIVRNLFPLFGLYTSKPESYFPRMREGCSLLNMLLGSALLLMDALKNGTENETKEILADVGVFKLSSDIVICVLKSRMDINVR